MGSSSGGSRVLQRTYEWGATAPSIAVVETIATLEDDDPVAIDAPLYESVDPEALDAIVGSSDEITISFDVNEYQIRIDDDELIVSDEGDDES